jgi:hypothetical protein
MWRLDKAEEGRMQANIMVTRQLERDVRVNGSRRAKDWAHKLAGAVFYGFVDRHLVLRNGAPFLTAEMLDDAVNEFKRATEGHGIPTLQANLKAAIDKVARAREALTAAEKEEAEAQTRLRNAEHQAKTAGIAC